jgi:hypothetical protein
MRKVNFVKLSVILLSFFLAGGANAEPAPESVVKLANTTIAAMGSDAVIVEAVKKENAKNKSLDEIKSMDAKWKAFAGTADYMKALMDSGCGKHLRTIQASESYFAEIFVMDNQGANAAMTDKTSDYWQGDEAKFQKAFNNGKGAVFVDEVEFDDSAQAYLCQVSVPVKDGGQVIGTITVGIDVDQLP